MTAGGEIGWGWYRRQAHSGTARTAAHEPIAARVDIRILPFFAQRSLRRVSTEQALPLL
jgi:hypothetical protein